jgi:uncharacterized membrane protein YqjE
MSSSVLPPDGGLASNAATLIESLLRLIGVRFSMAILELAEARDTLVRVLLLGAVALIAAVFALLSVSGMVVVLAWAALGWRIFLLLFLFYLLLTIALLLKARSLIVSGKIGLPVTLAELKKDRVAIFNEVGYPDSKA